MITNLARNAVGRVRALSTTSMSTSKLYVAVIGVGLVGSEFLDQLTAIPSSSSPFQLIAFTSSKKQVLSTSTHFTSESWRKALESSSEQVNHDALSDSLSKLVSPTQKVVVVDNTSSDDIAKRYPGWLRAGLNIATPNKKAFSGDSSLYSAIVQEARQSRARALHESSVGAGLPIINTLTELVATGDNVCVCVSATMIPYSSQGVLQ